MCFHRACVLCVHMCCLWQVCSVWLRGETVGQTDIHYPVRNGGLKETLDPSIWLTMVPKELEFPPGISCWEEEVAEACASSTGNNL